MTGATLEALLAELAASLEGATLRDGPAGREVVVADAVVAVLEPGALVVRLRPTVAAAALGTPDVEPSARGRGWVRFAPPALDEYALDRASAWLASAVRLAAEGDAAG